MKIIFFLLIIFTFVGCESFPVDTAMGAFEGKDLTAPIEGCGNQPIIGYTYCRKAEGEIVNDYISILGPISNCDREEGCVFFRIYYPEGDLPAYSAWLPKTSMRAKVLWKDLVKKERFTIGDRGYWPIKYWVYWKDGEGNEMVSETDGEIRLRVISNKYTPLHENAEDPNFAWRGVDKNGTVLKVTTKLRAYVKGK